MYSCLPISCCDIQLSTLNSESRTTQQTQCEPERLCLHLALSNLFVPCSPCRTMAGSVRASLLLATLALARLAPAQYGQEQMPLKDFAYQEACPDYRQYSAYPHRPGSGGPFDLPFQRPDPRCRTFHSDAIEQVIADMTARIKNPDLARLFENAFPSTTDTTVKFHTTGSTDKKKHKKTPWDEDKWEGPHSFIITGDIIAEWLRDSTNQLSPYQPLAKKDPAIYNLILGAINTQAEYVIESPYCNAFQPPPISGLPVTHNGQDDNVHPVYEPTFVFECKYELDSLAHFLALSNDFNDHTASKEFMTPRWYLALETLLNVLEQQSQPTFNPETGRFWRNEYTFSRNTNTGTETLNLNGIGNPLNNGTGLVRSAFRPSDDATILGFFIPANAMMAVELKRTAAILKDAGKDVLAQTVDKWSQTIANGIWEHGIVRHSVYGNVFAYEVDGYGSSILMDDANYPSLLALPLMGFVEADNEIYQNTRRMLLSKAGNPYYLAGREFHGIGGPHIGLQNAWPMSLLIQAQTSDDDEEIWECLDLVLRASKLGLLHESVNVDYIHSYTRSWFAWANGVFAETLLDVAKRKPHLIFKEPASPYEI
ncbi:glycoside hydrolase family 125 protein [Whalleya microplaca]|nr:glycoside hydrolase family 125 protein [Whalleya microplaca]